MRIVQLSVKLMFSYCQLILNNTVVKLTACNLEIPHLVYISTNFGAFTSKCMIVAHYKSCVYMTVVNIVIACFIINNVS